MATMGLLNVNDYLTVTPTRVVDEANNTRTSLGPVDVVPFLNEPQVISGERGKRFIQTGVIRVKKVDDQTPDLKDGDEIPLPEGKFGIVGGPQRTRVHSMTGVDFGWVRYSIRRGG